MAIYRKYRPKIFGEICAQSHITENLQMALKRGEVGHAYLLVGTRGTGKTSVARILATAINCENVDYVKKYGDPCIECNSCSLAIKGSHPDIIELDAASNRGIEEARRVKEAIAFSPTAGKKKVYIIDEVHMMTKEAFNAILKTLEEPPSHVVFILCTTEFHKVPETIISRTQVFEFKPASEEQIAFKIKKILSSEGKNIDEEGIYFIARLARGSFRDSESILEKVLKCEKENISYRDVFEILGFSILENVKQVKSYIYEKNVVKIALLLDKILDDGNVLNFNYQLCGEIYRDLLLDLRNDSLDFYKINVFDFLCSVEKSLKNSLMAKITYISSLLKFLTEHSSQTIDSHSSQQSYSQFVSSQTKSASTQDVDKDFKNNHGSKIDKGYLKKNVDQNKTLKNESKINEDESGVFDDGAFCYEKNNLEVTTEKITNLEDKFVKFLIENFPKINFVLQHINVKVIDKVVYIVVESEFYADIVKKAVNSVNFMKEFEDGSYTLEIKLKKRKESFDSRFRNTKNLKVSDLSEEKIKSYFKDLI